MAVLSKRKIAHQKYIASDEWAKIRADIITSRGHKCEICGHTEQVHVHHLSYDNFGAEESDDLIVLCPYHHMLEHGIVKEKKKAKKLPKKNKRTKKAKRKKKRDKPLIMKALHKQNISTKDLREKATQQDFKGS